MSDCKYCKEAEKSPMLGIVDRDCLSCQARMIAAVGATNESAKRMFPNNLAEAEPLIRKWAEAIRQTQKR